MANLVKGRSPVECQERRRMAPWRATIGCLQPATQTADVAALGSCASPLKESHPDRVPDATRPTETSHERGAAYKRAMGKNGRRGE